MPVRRASSSMVSSPFVTSLTGQSYSGLCAIDSCNTQVMNFAWLIAQGGGAGGAPLTDLIGGAVVGGALALVALGLGMAHRAHRIHWLGRLASFSERVSGLPRWASLPSAVGGGALLLALAGFWWDVATHIDNGRDQGPFGTAAHWPIMLGLAGIALAGYLAVILGCDDDEPTAVRLRGGWSAPLGGVLLLACGGFALLGFPLDDTWHRLFGQDVTLWGPTHVLMIGSASLATVAVWVLLVEGRRSSRRSGLGDGPSPAASLLMRLRKPMIAGGFLIGLSSLQGEFDFGVPQYALVLHPVMLMVAAGTGLVTARIVLGRFGALQAVAFYLIVRVVLTTMVDPVLGHSTQHFPLYLAEACLVELAAWRLGTQRPLRFGLVSGALIGTVGLAAEWAWTHVWMPIPWPEAILGEVALLAPAAALAGGVLGAYVGGTLRDPDAPPRIGPAWAAAVGGAVIVLCVAFPLPKGGGEPATAAVSLRTVAPAPNRTVEATVRVRPADAAANTEWMTATSWQGGGLVVNRMRRIAPGLYRTTQPLAVHGNWKTLIRMSTGRALRAVPIYLPADPQIPAPAVPARDRVVRQFVNDGTILQRESRGGALAAVLPAYLLLGLIFVGEFPRLTWGLMRVRRIPARVGRGEPRFGRTPVPTPV